MLTRQRPLRAPAQTRSPGRLVPAALAAAPAVEPLEERRLFAAVFPSAQEQYILQLINRARADPAADVARQVAAGRWKGTPQSIDEGVPAGTYPAGPRQPLALNPFLIDAARGHSQWLFDNPGVSPDGHTQIVNGQRIGPGDRMARAGYVFSGQSSGSENVWTTATTDTENNDLLRLQQEPLNDWNASGGVPGRGHRGALLNNGANEVGLGFIKGTDSGASLSRVTMDFANAGKGSFLVGVAIKDLNADQFYQPGEGLGGVTITATRAGDNQVFTTTTWDSGGYSLKLDPGTYSVAASGGTIGTPAAQVVTITTQNVAADFVQATAALSPPVIVVQPKDTTPFLSATQYSFTVAATGTPTPTVQWQSAPFNTTTWTDVPGATSYTYTNAKAGAANGTQYRAVLANSQGTATSNVGTLFLQGGTPLPITVTTYPADQTVNAGQTVTFQVAASGYTSLQWYYTGLNGAGDRVDVPGATSPTLTFTADASMTGRTYWVSLRNPSGGQDLPANLIVNAAPTTPAVVTQPTNPVTTPAEPATIQTAVTGFPQPTVTLQQQNPDDGTWADWDAGDVGADAPRALRPLAATPTVTVGADGQVTISVPVTSADNGAVLRAVVSNGEGSVTTNPVRLTVNDKPAVANDRAALSAAIGRALDAVEACRKATAAQIKTLSRDLKRTNASKEAKTALAGLSAGERASRKAYLANQKHYLSKMASLAKRIEKDVRKLARRPGDPAVTERLTQSAAALQALVDASTAPADAAACKLAQAEALDALLAAAPDDGDLRAHVLSAGQNANNVAQALQAPVAIAQAICARIVGRVSV